MQKIPVGQNLFDRQGDYFLESNLIRLQNSRRFFNYQSSFSRITFSRITGMLLFGGIIVASSGIHAEKFVLPAIITPTS